MGNWYVYILRCKNGTFYSGITSNIKRRFLEYKEGGGGRYTRLSKMDEMVYWEKCDTKEEALRREKQIKGWRKDKKLNLIRYGNHKEPA